MRKESKASPVRLKGWKRWAFPLAAMILVPGLFFVLLEVVLRVANFGYPSDFLIKQKLTDATVYTDNRSYGWRFFPPAIARRPADIVLPTEKSPKAFRVFVLGESAAMGDPDPGFSIPRMLDVMLSERFPDREFEVVNAAMTGISSHIIQDIAKQCAKFQPDCFVIYMGNNEAIGPYGPGTVFASFSRNLALTRLSIDARALKTSQMIERAMNFRKDSNKPEGWGGLRVFMKSQFHPTDEKIEILQEHYEKNLKDICATAQKAGAKLVLCTVASSLEDCAPFASLNAPSLSLEQKSAWDAKWAAAEKATASGDEDGALKALGEAEAIDASFAELHYRKGKLLAALNRHEEARGAFAKARDFDALKFRTSSSLNSAVEKRAEELSSPDVAFVDVVKAIEKDSPGGLVGSAHFVDHVHFNFRGNYIAAREIFESVSKMVSNSGSGTAAALSEEECAKRLAYTPWNRSKIAEHMLGRFQVPPFNTKSDHAERIAELKGELDRVKDARSEDSIKKAIALYEQALQRDKTDPDFLRSLAELHGELNQATEEMKYREILFARFPYDPDRKAFLAEAYSRSDKFAEAERLAREVLAGDRFNVLARMALASALHRKGATDEAVTEYEMILRLRPDMPEIRERLARIYNNPSSTPVLPPATPGQAPPVQTTPSAPPSNPVAAREAIAFMDRGQKLLDGGRVDEGLRELQMAVKLDGSSADIRMALAAGYVQKGSIEEAIVQCKEGLRLRPDFSELHNNVSVLLTEVGRTAEARTHLEEAVRLNPNFDDAHLNLALNLMKADRPQDSLVHFERFIKNHPNEADVHLQMGMLYETVGNWDKAAGAYRLALRVQPQNGRYQGSLAWILATCPKDELRNGPEALRLAESATRTEKDGYFLDILGAAFAEVERFPEAIKAAQDAAALARAANDASGAQEIDARIALYQSKKPYRSKALAKQ